MSVGEFFEDVGECAFEEVGVLVNEVCNTIFIHGCGYQMEDSVLDEVASFLEDC